LSLFSGDMILYLKILKIPPKKLLNLINTFSKVGYKLKTQISAFFLHTTNEEKRKISGKQCHLQTLLKKKKPSNEFN
jgi:DNA-binding winged helix-turn-helix (wHTH) protein